MSIDVKYHDEPVLKNANWTIQCVSCAQKLTYGILKMKVCLLFSTDLNKLLHIPDVYM